MAKSNELQIFEALESLTHNDSFCSRSSLIQNFIQLKFDLNNTQQSIPEEVLDSDISFSSKSYSESPAKSEVSRRSVSFLLEQSDNDDDKEDEEEDGDGDEESSGGDDDNELVENDESGNDEVLETDDEDDDDEILETDNGDDNEIVETVNGDDDEILETANGVDDEVLQAGDGGDVNKKLKTLLTDDKELNLTVDLDESMEETKGIALWTEYFKLKEAREKLELEQTKLVKQQEFFKKRHSIDDAKLKDERKRVENQRKQLQSLISDYHKMQFSKEEYEAKVKDLTEQLKEAKIQMNKRISQCNTKQKKLEERVKALEKENEELKKNVKSVPQRLAALKRPPMRCIAVENAKNKKEPCLKRRVQFADGLSGEDSPENKEIQKKTPPTTTISKSPETSMSASQSPSSFSSGSKSPGEGQTEKTPRKVTDSSQQSEELENKCEEEKEVHLSDDEADKTMPSDYFEYKYPNGTITRVTKDNKLIRHVLINKDIMDEFEDCSIRYYYHELGFSQTTYPNGEEIIEYDSGEIEMIRSDGSKVYTYKDGLVRMVDSISGSEEMIFGDGVSVQKTADGGCTVTWPSGQKEFRTPNYVKRVYPNGTIKILYADGSEETRYCNGRVRRKDKNGMLVDDTKKKEKRRSKSVENETDCIA